MLDRDTLEKSLDLHERTHRLIRWLDASISKGFISRDTAREYMINPKSAQDWISEHFLNLPPDCRPVEYNSKEIQLFSKMFGSYLVTSFDIVNISGKRYVPHLLRNTSGDRYVDNPNLRPKKIQERDRSRAKKLKIEYIQNLANECGIPMHDDLAQSIVEDSDLKESVAIATYAEQLINRMFGRSEGAATLALWREFAWTASGSPKKKFQLKVDNIIESVELLKAKILK